MIIINDTNYDTFELDRMFRNTANRLHINTGEMYVEINPTRSRFCGEASFPNLIRLYVPPHKKLGDINYLFGHELAHLRGISRKLMKQGRYSEAEQEADAEVERLGKRLSFEPSEEAKQKSGIQSDLYAEEDKEKF